MSDVPLFKNFFNLNFYEYFIEKIKVPNPDFNKDDFLNDIFCDEWESYELKQRMRHSTICLKKQMPENFEKAADMLIELSDIIINDNKKPDNLMFIFLPDYIELYGLDHFEKSIEAFEHITKLISCEFAVRPFIIKYKTKMMDTMLIWAKHKNDHIRRLASEGCRPRLPWAMALPEFKKDPSLIIPILQNLKYDQSEYVRKSVANNLNDISKDNPEIAINIFNSWYGENPYTDKIVKHAARTLLKSGNTDVLKLFGYEDNINIKLKNFTIDKETVKVGYDLYFGFDIENNSKEDVLLRIEYKLYFMKSNGKTSPKVFQITEKEFSPGTTSIKRKQHFKQITTRKYYEGEHHIDIIINGKKYESKYFYLVL